MARYQDPFGAELRRFIDDMDKRKFRAAHTGFGFAEIKEKREPQLPQRFTPAKVVQPLEWRPPTFVSSEPVLYTMPPENQRPVVRKARSFGISKLIFSTLLAFASLTKILVAHAIDILVVASTGIVSLFLAAIVLAPARSEGIVETIQHWDAWQSIRDLNVLFLVVTIYGLYALYWGVMRFVAGHTLGHTLLKNARP